MPLLAPVIAVLLLIRGVMSPSLFYFSSMDRRLAGCFFSCVEPARKQLVEPSNRSPTSSGSPCAVSLTPPGRGREWYRARRHDQFRGEPACVVLKGVGVQIEPGNYYARNSFPPSAHAVRDAFRVLTVRDKQGGFGIYAPWKINAELNREGLRGPGAPLSSNPSLGRDQRVS